MRNDKCAIAVFTLLVMLFFLIFVMVIYRNIAAKSKTQVETTEILFDTYDFNTDSSDAEVVFTTIASTENSYIGYFADVDADGWVDGIIFADLAVAESDTWKGDTDGTYIYLYAWSAVTSGLKEYELTEVYTDKYFGTGHVITPVVGTSGTDRFYVMDLEDTAISYWFYNALGEISSSLTSTSFGYGKSNTTKFLSYWANKTYGEQNPEDMWRISVIGSNIGDSDSIWFVLSYYEWIAFAGAFDITNSNYSSTYGLSGFYWSSSLNSWTSAYFIQFFSGTVLTQTVSNLAHVRLATTF